MVGRELGGLTLGRAVDQHGDVALFQADHVIGRVHMGLGKAHQLQPRDHGLGLRAGELDEFKAVHAQRVLGVQSPGGGGLRGVVHGESP